MRVGNEKTIRGTLSARSSPAVFSAARKIVHFVGWGFTSAKLEERLQPRTTVHRAPPASALLLTRFLLLTLCSHHFRPSILAPRRSRTSPAASVSTPTNFNPLLAPFNFHKARVRHASGFLLTAFSNARPNILFRSTRLTKGAPPKKH